MSSKRFPSPFEIEGPEGVDGWEELYPYSTTFGEHRRDYDWYRLPTLTEETQVVITPSEDVFEHLNVNNALVLYDEQEQRVIRDFWNREDSVYTGTLPANTPLFANTFGALDFAGRSQAQFVPPAGLLAPAIGTDLDFAYVLVPFQFASNPVRVRIDSAWISRSCPAACSRY